MTIKVSKPAINIREKLNDLDFDKVPFQKMPAGSVVQVVSGIGAADPETATTSTSNVATGIYASITPKSKNNKIYCSVSGGMFYVPGGEIGFLEIYRDDVNLGHEMRVRADYTMGSSTTGNTEAPVSLECVDSPNTIEEVTYKLYIRSNIGVNVQVNNHTSTAAVMTLMEIVG